MENHKNPPFEGGDLGDTLKLDPYLTQKFCKKELDPKNWYTKHFDFEEMRKKIKVLDDLLSGIRLQNVKYVKVESVKSNEISNVTNSVHDNVN